MNRDEIAKAFLQQYYTAMMTNRAALLNFYTNSSTMTYGGTVHNGIESIKNKIESFSYSAINFEITDNDTQEGPVPGSLFIQVLGQLVMDGTDKFMFCQGFVVCPNGQGGMYVHNDVFRTIG